MRGVLAGLILSLAVAGAVAAQGVSAILEPVQIVEVKPSVAGRLAEIAVAEGDRVTLGTPLAAIDARVQQARVSLAQIAADATGEEVRANLVIEQAEKLVARITKARERGAAQAWEVRQAEQALSLARADATIAQENGNRLEAQLELERATLSEFGMNAPFDGTVLQIFVEPGETVGTDRTIMEFGNLSRLKATAFMPVDWAQALSVGDAIPATIIGGNQSSLTLMVAAIDPRIDPASRSVRVRLEVDNAERSLFAGTAIQLQRP